MTRKNLQWLLKTAKILSSISFSKTQNSKNQSASWWAVKTRGTLIVSWNRYSIERLVWLKKILSFLLQSFSHLPKLNSAIRIFSKPHFCTGPSISLIQLPHWIVFTVFQRTDAKPKKIENKKNFSSKENFQIDMKTIR